MKLPQSLLLLVLYGPLLAMAQLAVTVLPVKVVGQKAIVPLAMKNNFTEEIESARAAVFLTDEQGKVVGRASRWVIGGSNDKPGLKATATNVFNFVITIEKPLTSTNLTSKVMFNRLILQGGKTIDPMKNVIVIE